MKLALIDASTVLHVWPVPEGSNEAVRRYTFDDGSIISPIKLGWTDGTYSVVAVTEFTVPEGKVAVGVPSYEIISGEVIESFAVEDYRPMVLKSTVQQRLIDAGKMDAAYAALTSNATYFARWFAPDHGKVYCDDPDAISLVTAIGADPDIILAPEDE